jgi:hypothetical protein
MDDAADLTALTAADFQERIGESFRVALPDGSGLDLTLAVVQTSRYAPPAARRTGFSLVFWSALTTHVPQAIYTLRHPAMGRLDLFLVPIGLGEGGMGYEAVFS